MRKVKEKRPELGERFLIMTPPMSREFQVFSGGFAAVGRGASAMGPTMDEGWFAFAWWLLGEVSAEALLTKVMESSPFCSLGGGLLGFVMVTADFATVREAIALALAR